MQVTDEMVEAAAAQMMQYGVNAPESTIYAAARSALTAALAKAWRQIEEGKEDWTNRLLYLPNTGIKIDIGHYDLIKRGWVAFKSLGIVSPTHWMPLPEPPAAARGGVNGDRRYV